MSVAERRACGVRAEIRADYGAQNIASAFYALALWRAAPNVEEAYYLA